MVPTSSFQTSEQVLMNNNSTRDLRRILSRFGIGSDSRHDTLILGLVNAAPYFACVAFACWLTVCSAMQTTKHLLRLKLRFN